MNWTLLCPSHRVWSEVKVLVFRFRFRFSWGLACVHHVIMTLWVLSPGVPLCLSSTEMRKEYSKMSWICSVFSSVGLRQPNLCFPTPSCHAEDLCCIWSEGDWFSLETGSKLLSNFISAGKNTEIFDSQMSQILNSNFQMIKDCWLCFSRGAATISCLFIVELCSNEKKSIRNWHIVRIKFSFSVQQLIDSSLWSRTKYLNKYWMNHTVTSTGKANPVC